MVNMQTNQKILANVLCAFGVIVLLLQLVSCFLLPWMTYDIEDDIPNSQDLHTSTRRSTSISIGLWNVKACVTEREREIYRSETRCVSMKTVDFIDAVDASSQNVTVKEAVKKFLLGFIPLKMLTLFGVITTISGIISVFLYIWKSSKVTAGSHRSVGIYCILSWLISAVLVLTAVGIQLRQNADLENEAQTQTAMPGVKKILTVSERSRTAFILSVIGGVLSILEAGTITVLMLLKSRSGPQQMGFKTLQIKESDEAQEDLCSGTIDKFSMTV